MKKDIPLEVQRDKIAKARTKRLSKRSAKNGTKAYNDFKSHIIHNLPYGLDKVPLRVGQQFCKTETHGSVNYVQVHEIVNIMRKNEDTGEWYENPSDVPEDANILEVPVTAKKTIVRL